MTEGSETWQVDGDEKVVDICGTREELWLNIAHKYSSGLKNIQSMYGTEGNIYMAKVPDSKNKYNFWVFRDIIIKDDEFLSLDLREMTKARGSAGELPNINFLKFNPKEPNYTKLKIIEDELSKYTISDDGVKSKK